VDAARSYLPLDAIEARGCYAGRVYFAETKRSPMHRTADPPQNLQPYGLLGLCLSLVGIAGLVLVITVAIGGFAALVAGLTFGWHAARGFFVDATTHQQGEGVAPLRFVLGVSLAAYVAIGIAILAFARWRGGAHWRSLVGLGQKVWRLNDKLLWAIAVGALIYSVAATTVLGYFYPKSQSWLTIPTDRVAYVMLFLLAVVLAPITEELLFRGWIYTSLRFSFGLWPALLASSALFGVAHYENTHLYALVVFPMGLALGAIRERTGSVKASMLFHAFNNFIAFCAAALSVG
jgi:membrane protease YdiL (CAAX protease family)